MGSEHRFVPAETVVALFGSAPGVDYERLRNDLDRVAGAACPSHRVTSGGSSDTSALVDLERLDPESLPVEVAVSALTMANSPPDPRRR